MQESKGGGSIIWDEHAIHVSREVEESILPQGEGGEDTLKEGLVYEKTQQEAHSSRSKYLGVLPKQESS
jgi:hypothetical protein